jgi:hypothetical protein
MIALSAAKELIKNPNFEIARDRFVQAIPTCTVLRALLEYLDEPSCEIVLTALKDKLPRLITTFEDVLQLNKINCNFDCAVKPICNRILMAHLEDVVVAIQKNPFLIEELLYWVSDAVFNYFLGPHKLNQMIVTTQHLVCLFKILPDDAHVAKLKCLRNIDLPKLITTFEDVLLIFQHISDFKDSFILIKRYCAAILMKNVKETVALIQENPENMHLLSFLNSDAVFNYFLRSHLLKHMIVTTQHLVCLFKILPNDAHLTKRRCLQNIDLPKLITTFEDVLLIFQHISDFKDSFTLIKRYCAAILMKNAKETVALIQENPENMHLLSFLNSDERDILLLDYGLLSDMTTRRQIFVYLFSLTTPKWYWMILNMLTKNFPELITTPLDVLVLQEYFWSSANSGVFYFDFERKNSLSPIKRLCVKALMNDPAQTAETIQQDPANLSLLKWLDFSQRNDIISRINLTEFVTTSQHLIDMLHCLDGSGCKIVLESLGAKLFELIKTPKNVLMLEKRLKNRNRDYLRQKLQGLCSMALMQNLAETIALIKQDPIHIALLSWLTDDQCIEVIDFLKNPLDVNTLGLIYEYKRDPPIVKAYFKQSLNIQDEMAQENLQRVIQTKNSWSYWARHTLLPSVSPASTRGEETENNEKGYRTR